jgi:hypothetical protein
MFVLFLNIMIILAKMMQDTRNSIFFFFYDLSTSADVVERYWHWHLAVGLIYIFFYNSP